MRAHPRSKRSFQLEALETRTLLAAGGAADPFGLVADFDLTMRAVSGTGDFQGSFSTNFGNHQLVLTGHSDTSVTIDLAQLPGFITNLKISSFGDVHIVGTDHIDNLILSGVGSVSASGLSVDQATFATNVSSLSVAALGGYAALRGSDMKLTATSLEGTQIISYLDSLTLTSESKLIDFTAAHESGSNRQQSLNLTYVPDPTLIAISGIDPSSVHVLLPGVGNVPAVPSTTPGGTQPVDPIVSNPDLGAVVVNPSPVTDTPKITDVIDASDVGKLVIVSRPLDDRTRALLDQLRDIFHSAQPDSEQRVIDLLNHASLGTPQHSVNPLLAAGFTALDVAALSSTRPLPLVDFASGALNVAQLGNSDLQIATQSSLAAEFGRFTPQALETLPANESGRLTVMGVADVDVSWPVAIAASLPVDSNSSATQKSNKGEPSPSSLSDSVRALGNYLVQRMSAEFSPGQQSLVLLVDPQPSRSIGSSKKSVLGGVVGDEELPITAALTTNA